jgi:hypothetical protein
LCGFFFFLLFEIFQTNNSLKIDKIQTKNQSFFEIFQRNNFLKQRNNFLKQRNILPNDSILKWHIKKAKTEESICQKSTLNIPFW